MTLKEASAKALPLAIRIDEANDRVMSEAFIVPGGLAFAGVYWREAAGRHPYHFIEGEISGNGLWRIGTAEVRTIDHGDPRAAEWNRGAAYRATPECALSTREKAWEEIAGAQREADHE